MREPLKPVGADDFERRLAEAAAQAAGDAEGLFGPASTIWLVDREAALFLGAGRALLMQLAHPWVATAIGEHSAVLHDPVGRFHRTFAIMFTLVFGSRPQALAAARRLHRRHAGVRGALPEALGPRHPAGSAYQANDEAALLWVHATLVDTALLAYEIVLPPLGAEARERYYGECRRLGLLFGIPAEAQPPDWAGFRRYRDATLASPELAVAPAAREIAASVLSGAGRLPVPRWFGDVTALLLPERLRAEFRLAWGGAERRRAERALAAIRRTYPLLPRRLRHVGPYQEAQARLAGRKRPDLWTRSLNRLWIGRPLMES